MVWKPLSDGSGSHAYALLGCPWWTANGADDLDLAGPGRAPWRACERV